MSKTNLNELFGSAKDRGVISQSAAMTLSAPDVGAQIQNGMGVSAEDIEASEVFLLTQMIDDSGSIRFAGKAQAVREGHNLVLDEMGSSQSEGDILALTRYLNGHVLFPYVPLANALRLDSGNYNPNLGTPLYDQAVVLFGTVLAKEREFADQGVPCRTATLLVTDGQDEHSVQYGARQSREIVEDMLQRETHIIAAMGIDNGSTDYEQVFKEMGIPKEWILTPASDGHSIREAFGVFSKASKTASQGAASFSQVAGGGFGSA